MSFLCSRVTEGSWTRQRPLTLTLTLRRCADQLTDVLTNTFQISLSSGVILNVLQVFSVSTTVSCCTHTHHEDQDHAAPSLDPLQFVYCPNLNRRRHRLHHPPPSQMLFTDFSSALTLNTIISQHLIRKLSLLDPNTSLCNWILDFVTGSRDREQHVQHHHTEPPRDVSSAHRCSLC